MQTFRDTYSFRYVLFALTAKELKAQYRNMSLGFLWALLNPLVMLVVLTFVFTQFWGRDLEYTSLIVVTLIPWNFISYCTNGSVGAVLGNASLVRKVRFPRQILPFSVILTHLVHFAVQSLLVVVVLMIFPHPGDVLSFRLLWLVPILILQIGLCIALSLLVSSLHVVYRDTQYIIGSVMMILFWASPVIYDPRSLRPNFIEPDGHLSTFARVYFSNPVAGILDSFRCVLFYGQSPSAYALLAAFAGVLVLGVIGMRVFWIHEREFADLVR